MEPASRFLTASWEAAQRWLRSNAFAHVVIAVIAGALAGAAVTGMSYLAEAMHVAIFGIAFDERLSAKAVVSPIAAFASLGLGGLVMGLFEFWRRRRGFAAIVDPIEANALRGGRLSLRDGVVVVAQTVISNGCGASVGLEAGYAQIGSAIASRLGLAANLRRQDLRMMVGCGAAGAIAAAFAAPLTGAFYAFELIIGGYTLATPRPVIAAAVAGALVVRTLGGAPYLLHAPEVAALGVADHFALIGLGLISAALGVGAMRAAALVERGFQASPLPQWARPVAGGLIVAVFAIFTPQALGAGHGALDLDMPRTLTAATLAMLILLKLTACLVSLASGFRGGLFFASLFVGALLGKLYAHRARGGVAGPRGRSNRLHLRRHGDARRGDRRRPADHGVSGAGKLRRSAGRRRRARRVHRDQPRGAHDIRLFVLDLAPASARRDDPRRAGHRLAARTHGRAR